MSEARKKLLIIDDEVAIRKFLIAGMLNQNYEVFEAGTGTEGIRLAATESPNLILLDLGLPDIDGVEVTKRIREWSDVPSIILSARGDEADKINGLDSGANDYLTKPFSLPELFARMRVAIRQPMVALAVSDIRFGPLALDLSNHRLLKNGVEIHLTKTEFKLLALLARNLGKMMTHSQILREVWGPEYETELHYLRVYAQQLRLKIEDDPARPKILITETGIGYRLRGELES